MAVITAKIATVLGATSIAVNVGTKQGVADGDLVRLFNRVPVVDPDTQKSLGSIIRTLLLLRVDAPAELFSIARVVPSNSLPFKFLTDDAEEAESENGYLFVEIGQEVQVEKPKVQAPPSDDTELDDLPF